MSGRRAAFLDRDGVLNELVVDPHSGGVPESPLRVEDVRLIAGASAAAARLARAGLVLACVTNQPAAAKGTVPLEQLLAVHGRVVELLALEGVRLEVSRLCLHHPEGVVPELSGSCACRKPAPGMLLDAAEELGSAEPVSAADSPGLDLAASWMVGDTDADVAAGRAAGCHTVLVEYPGSAHKRSERANPELLAPDLAGAVERILGPCRGKRGGLPVVEH